MTVVFREMRPAEAEAVVAMIRALAVHVDAPVVPRITAKSLIANRHLVDTVVAEDDGRLLGACLSLLTYSTWRDACGLYVVDLFVEPEGRGRGLGRELLRLAARRGMERGASYIRLDVDADNGIAKGFYDRLGFHSKADDRLYFLEPEELESFLK